MYLMSNLTTRGNGLKTLRALRATSDPHEAHRTIADALPPLVASVMSETELETMRQRLVQMPEPRGRLMIDKDDWLGAVGVFLLVFLSTFPVVIPFIFIHEAQTALRVSNAVAIVMLFVCGFSLGRHAGQNPWLIGLAMVLLGAFLAALTLALGG
jgi:VIT1/CCC1 family predicted Fe2+/Mn2+ transporter